MTLRILLTNDDGIDSPGLAVLRHALDGLGELTVIAPERNNSAAARSITTQRPLTLRPVNFGEGWPGLACDGTPSDCVRAGMFEAPDTDIVVSGVNLGANEGTDITYSGTVGAALEGALRGRLAVAFSYEEIAPTWLPDAAPVIREIVAQTVRRGLPCRSILNVNLPDRPLADIRGVRPARIGGASYHDRVAVRRAPAGGDGGRPPASLREHILSCEEPETGKWADTDMDLLARGYVTVTPIRYDLLDATMLTELETWDFDLAGIGSAI